MILVLEALHKQFPEIPRYNKDLFTSKVICNINDVDCMSNNCEVCCDGQLLREEFMHENINVAKQMKWEQWDKTADGFVKKVEQEGTAGDAFECLAKQRPRFLWHSFVKDKQSDSYAANKAVATDSNSNTCLSQMDFSENFTCIWQDEIATAHFKRRQIKLYTIVYHHRSITKSCVIVSDVLDHNKHTVAAFTASLLRVDQMGIFHGDKC